MIQPIQDHIILNILQYIVPPSRIAQELPSHLLSSSLLKRHHFLGLHPTDPVEYLCWPAGSSDQAVHYLETTHILEDAPDFAIRYTSDPEHTHAHILIPSRHPGVRIVFQWEHDGGWKYHDLRLMPISSPFFESLDDALALHTNGLNGLSDANHSSEPTPLFANSPENDEESYWDSYGAQIGRAHV